MSRQPTIKTSFRDSIARGDWEGIRKVFHAITGEIAPAVPVIKTEQETLLDKLDEPMPAYRGKTKTVEGALNESLEQGGLILGMDVDEEFKKMKKETLLISPRETSWDLAEAASQEEEAIENHVPDTLPVQEETEAPPTSAVDDFSIQHGTSEDRADEDGNVKCRREKMNIPQQRTNRFNDNETLFLDESVREHPENPGLGIQKVRPRSGARALIEGSADTSQKIDVKCGLCGKEERVSAMLSQGYSVREEHNTYRCNTCTSPKGQAMIMRQRREEELNGGRRRRKR